MIPLLFSSSALSASIVSNSIAGKLQRAFYKVNVLMQTQEGDLIVRKKTHTQAGSFGQGYATSANSDVVITEGAGVSWIDAYSVDKNNVFKIGDLKVYIPGQLVTEEQLTQSVIVYQDKTYSIVSKLPDGAISRIPVGWLIVARLEA